MKCNMELISDFCARVYDAVRAIPRGRVATYGGIVRALGCGSARAVGQALRRNPFAPVVPCHRVISSNLRPGGFQGRTSGAATARKRMLLAAEGVRFDASGRLCEPDRVWRA